MIQVTKFIAAGLFAIAPLATSIQSAQASNPNFAGAAIARINGEGFRACKAMGNSGYTAIARGIISEGGGGGRRGSLGQAFQIRTCFKTSSACENFIDRIHHKVGKIDELRYINCKPRA